MTLVGATREHLVHAGMSHRTARVHARRIALCDRALTSLGADNRRWSAWVPGRVELLGKHTDYAGGRSLLCDVERGFAVRAAARGDRVVRVVDTARGLRMETGLDAPVRPGTAFAAGAWERYVETVVRRLVRDFGIAHGADVALASDLPVAAGLSSSSALIIAVHLALAAANALETDATFRFQVPSREALAAYLGAVENGQPFGQLRGDAGVGTLGGSQDQTALLCCEAGFVSRYAFVPVRWEGAAPFPADHVLAIGVSGVASEKTGAAMEAYNKASLSARKLVELWRAKTGRDDATLGAAADSAPDAPDALGAIADLNDAAIGDGPRLRDRLDQFLAEANTIVPQAFDALARGDFTRLGELVDESERLAEEKLRNQVTETIALQRIARDAGAVAASAFGAGFGGSVWALVPVEGSGDFLSRWRGRYLEAIPARAGEAEFFLTRAGPGAARWR